MATIIQIKRSTGVTAPTTTVLAEGELAYTQDRTNDGAGAVLYIESVASDGTTPVIDKIGGKYYTNTVDNFLTPQTGSVASKLNLKEGDGTSKIVLKAPDSLSADTTYTLPAAPTENYFLKTDASGNLSWTEVSGSTLNINNLTAVDPLDSADEFIVYDTSATANRKITAENVADYIYAGVSGDILIAENGTATIQANSVALGTDTTGNYVADVTAGAGLTKTSTASEGQTVDLEVGAGAGIAVDADVVRFKNSSSLSNGTVMGWDSSNTQLVNAPITYSGSDVTVTGDLTVTGNDIKSSSGSTAITLDGANVTVAGNLTVNGSSTIVNSTTVTVDDTLLKLADGNTAGNSIDMGVYGEYSESATTKFAGFFRDASDSNIFKFFTGLEAEPTSTVNTGGTGYTVATILANITGGTVSGLSADIGVADGGTGASTFTTNGVLYGNGASAIQVTSAGTVGQVLQANSSGVPVFAHIDGGTF